MTDPAPAYWAQALNMPADSRLIIKKLRPNQQPEEKTYRWVLAGLHADSGQMVIVDQFMDLQGALMEVDNIIHLEAEGKL